MRTRLYWSAVLVLATAGVLWAQDTTPVDGETEEELGYVPGLVFNASNLLLDLNEYQGGFGGKLRFPDFSLRALLALAYSSTNNEISGALGITYERPFFTGQIAPYWGIAAGGAYESQRTEFGQTDYSALTEITGSAGVVLGAELLLLDFVSLFAEYALTLSVASSSSEQSLGGDVTESNALNYAVATRLGNAGSIGIVLYLQPLGILSTDVAAE